MAQIVEFWIDGRVGQTAQERDEPFGIRITPKVPLCYMEGQVVTSGIGRCEFDPPTRENAQVVEPRFRSEQSATGQNLRSVES